MNQTSFRRFGATSALVIGLGSSVCVCMCMCISICNGQEKTATLDDLQQWLEKPAIDRAALADQPFAAKPLSKSDAVAVTEILWQEKVETIKETRVAEFTEKKVILDDKVMKYDFRVFGKEPEGGHSLFISMHGGGNAPPAVNDRQWKNQIGLYEPKEGIYVAPRAPTDTWNLWHQAHIDPMFDQLIADFVVFEGVNPNRVYLMGYSAGGDGVYQLAPRMADRFGAAAMMAGHPNETKPMGLRSLPFTLHMGGKDAAYKRNKIAGDWKEALAKLREANPDDYAHEVVIHEDKGHWMEKEDAVAVPWMAEFNRQPWPKRITWLQDDVTHDRFYWLALLADQAKPKQLIEAAIKGQTIGIRVAEERPDQISLRLHDSLVDLDQPVTVQVNGTERFSGKVSRTIIAIAASLTERADPASAASGLLVVGLKGQKDGK